MIPCRQLSPNTLKIFVWKFRCKHLAMNPAQVVGDDHSDIIVNNIATDLPEYWGSNSYSRLLNG